MNLAEMLAMADAATANVEVKTGFTVLKPGIYTAAVTAADGPHNSNRANPNNPNEFGQFIKVTFTIVEGEYTNRNLFLRNNIIVYPKSNSDEDSRKAMTAMAIGAKERKVLLEAIGKKNIQDASELIGAQCKINVIVQKDKNGQDQNSIKSIAPLTASTTPTSPSLPTPTVTPTPTVSPAPTANKLPWM